MAEHLPEGTDTIIEGAGVGGDDGDDLDTVVSTSAFDKKPANGSEPEQDKAKPKQNDTKANGDAPSEPFSFTDKVDAIKGQANDKARDFVGGLKDRATGSIDDIVAMIEQAAAEVDDKVGGSYGDYVRRAGDSVAGLSGAIKDKDVDALFDDVRGLIARSPGVAVGVAAAIGFVVARVARAGMPEAASSPKKA